MIWVVRARISRAIHPDHGNRGCHQDQISVLIICGPYAHVTLHDHEKTSVPGRGMRAGAVKG
jgi:hypothetical protein